MRGYYLEYLIFMLPAMILAAWAQFTVKSRYKKYSTVMNGRRITGYDAARRILDANGLQSIDIQMIGGNLSDHYDPKAKVIRLSQSVYQSYSVAAVGVASHEAGHAVQHAVGYTPIKLRTAILPVSRFGSLASPYLIVAGILFNFTPLFLAGIIAFCAVTLFQLVTLPVELNASRRALKIIEQNNMLVGEEQKGAKKVLTAAALTYVAALITSFIELLYYVIKFNRNKNN